MHPVFTTFTTFTWLLLATAPLVAAAPDLVRLGDATWHRSEWRVNTCAKSTQAQASLTLDDEENVLVVWSSRRQQGGRYGVYAQRLAADGTAIDGELPVNLWTDSHQWAPAADRSWVVWQSHGQDGHAGSIIARRLRDDASGSEILVNEEVRGHQSSPAIVAAPDGGALTVWTTESADGALRAVRGRRLDANGTLLGGEVVACDDEAYGQVTPAAAFLPGGGFVIAYGGLGADNRPLGIRMQRYDANGERIGAATAISGPGARGPIEPVIRSAPGGVIAAWLEADDAGTGYRVLARRLDATGRALGPPFDVAPEGPASQAAAAIAVRADGGFVLAFNGEDEDETGVFARLFAPDGSAAGSTVRLNRHVAGRQAMRAATGARRLTFTSGGALLCAWSGDGGTGDPSSVNVTMLSPEPIALDGREQGVTAEMMGRQSTAPAEATARAAEPHRPPTFDPRRIDAGAREVVIAPKGDVGFTGILDTGWTPPDPHLAVGPAHVVIMTNGAIAFLTKAGILTFQDQIEGGSGFWGSLGATSFVFDPEALYDELSGRFFVMASELAPANQSFALVAVSDDSDPNGSWHKYRFNTTFLAGATLDSPNIAVDAQAVYITGDAFSGAAAYPVFIYDKASLLAGNPPAIQRTYSLTTTTQSAGIPPVSFDAPPALYMIEHRESSSTNAVRLIALTDPLGTPAATTMNIAVPVYGFPENPPQAGTSIRPETFDARFWSVAYRNGSLWATHHVNSNRVVARWYEFAMNGWPVSGQVPTLVQSGTIDPGPTVRTFFCAITADPFGNASMVYARSAPSEFISMETAFRYKSDPPGTFRAGVQRRVNSSGYPIDRWGDYGGVNIDPVNGKTVWAHHEWAQSSSWRTWISGETPYFNVADIDCDGTVGFLDLLAVLSNWGPCDGCPEDTDGSGDVGFPDLLRVLSEWS